MLNVHTFESTAEAYDASQTREEIHDGDVLYVPSEDAIAVLVSAWPTALDAEHAGGSFHVLEDGVSWDSIPDEVRRVNNNYSASVALARETLLKHKLPTVPDWFVPGSKFEREIPEWGSVSDEVGVARDGDIRFGTRRLTQAEAVDIAVALLQAAQDSVWRTQIIENGAWYADSEQIKARADSKLGQAITAARAVYGV
jgi:hypothetical protein